MYTTANFSTQNHYSPMAVSRFLLIETSNHTHSTNNSNQHRNPQTTRTRTPYNTPQINNPNTRYNARPSRQPMVHQWPTLRRRQRHPSSTRYEPSLHLPPTSSYLTPLIITNAIPGYMPFQSVGYGGMPFNGQPQYPRPSYNNPAAGYENPWMRPPFAGYGQNYGYYPGAYFPFMPRRW